MSPKNLNVIKTPKNLILKLSNNKIKNLFRIFEKNFDVRESFAVAVSGGPDSLALAFLTKVFAIKYNLKSRYFILLIAIVSTWVRILWSQFLRELQRYLE